jgi:hypothetical protein
MTAASPRADKLKWCKDTRELAVTLASGKVYRSGKHFSLCFKPFFKQAA